METPSDVDVQSPNPKESDDILSLESIASDLDGASKTKLADDGADLEPKRDMSKEENRFLSFIENFWPRSLSQKPKDMAAAGFVYYGLKNVKNLCFISCFFSLSHPYR